MKFGIVLVCMMAFVSCTRQDSNVSPASAETPPPCIKLYDDPTEMDKAVLRSKGFTCYHREL